MSAAGHVALVCGGRTAATSTDIAETLEAEGFSVTPVATGDSLATRLSDLAPDAVLIAGLDPKDNDGRVQGVCETLGLAYTHSGIAATALAADRHLLKLVFKSAGLPVTDHVLADGAEIVRTHVLPPPYVVKPRFAGRGGAAILVRHAGEALPEGLRGRASGGGEPMMVERFVPGMTLLAFVMGDVAIGVAALTDRRGGTANEILIPAPISPKIYEECMRLALRGHGALGCRGVTALALRYDDRQAAGTPVVLGLDPLPDLGRTAPLSQIAARAGHSFGELLRWLVQDASCGKVV
ncbi:MAG: D-alanine--D-alanine ligase [Alphaproteobacteria bacterium]|nr:D-alanine--D-alanine ligase [Alphaproteobacteria bacterium]